MNFDKQIQQMLEQELKIMADEVEDIKVIRGGNMFNFPIEIREHIIYHSQYLFEGIEQQYLRCKMYKFIDLVTKYVNQGAIELLGILKKNSTTQRREQEKRNNMLKGISYIYDYLGGTVSYTERAAELKRLLYVLRTDPEKFKGKPNKRYTKMELKANLRELFEGKTDAINDFVDEEGTLLRHTHITQK